MGEGTRHHSGSQRTELKGESQGEKLVAQIHVICGNCGNYQSILLVRIVYFSISILELSSSSHYYLPRLFGGLRDGPDIVSINYAPKRRRQDWLSDSCFPPPLLLRHVHQSVHDVFVRLETHVGHVYKSHKEDPEQEGREHASLAKALFHSEPPNTSCLLLPKHGFGV